MSNKITPQINANVPHICTGGLEGRELADWLLRLSSVAVKVSQGYSAVLFELQSAESSLRYAIADLEPRINFLASDQIIRSADHSTAVQEDLDNLRMILAAVRNSQQTILSSVAQLRKIDHSTQSLCQQGPAQGCAGQELEKGIGDS